MVVEALVLPDAARVTTRIATRATLAAQQCTQMPQNGSERPFPPICVHSFVPTVACATGAPGDSRNSVHCHLAVNMRVWNAQARVAVSPTRGRTLRGEWQRVSHCQMASSVPKRYAWGRVAVQLTLPLGGERVVVEHSGPSGSAIGTLKGEWQCHPHEAARSGSSGSVAYTAKWHRAYRSGTLGVEWQCDRYARGRVAVRLTLPLGGERVVVERSGPSGSATHTRPHARGRVAVQIRATFGPAGAAPSVGMRPKRGHPEPCPERSLRKQRSL